MTHSPMLGCFFGILGLVHIFDNKAERDVHLIHCLLTDSTHFVVYLLSSFYHSEQYSFEHGNSMASTSDIILLHKPLHIC